MRLRSATYQASKRGEDLTLYAPEARLWVGRPALALAAASRSIELGLVMDWVPVLAFLGVFLR